MIDIDFDNLTEKDVYKAFGVEGQEAQALNHSYYELYEVIGKEATLKLFCHFRGAKINCPMKLYRAEYIADLAAQTADKSERARIARAGGYTVKFIEGLLNKRKSENKKDGDC